MVNENLDYVAIGTGDAPFWWSLSDFPTGARIDHQTGLLSWTPTQAGEYDFTVVLENGPGRSEQSFTYQVEETVQEDTGETDSPIEDSGNSDDVESSGDSNETDDSDSDSSPKGGCSHHKGSDKSSLWLLALLAMIIRKRKKLS